MRNFTTTYINGKRHELRGDLAFKSVADFLRYDKNLTGTKVVCAEGDCGACTILVARYSEENGVAKLGEYKSINSCISYMYLLDRCHIITVEGLGNPEHLHPVQETMLDHHGAQCGYCTPGFICSMAQMANDLKAKNSKPTEQKVKNYLTGNLCRCTGYEPIISAGVNLDMTKVEALSSLYDDDKILADFKSLKSEVNIKSLEQAKEVYLPNSLDSAFKFKHSNHDSRVASGATDLGVVQNKGKLNLVKILTLNNVNEAYQINDTKTHLEIGAKASLYNIEQSCLKEFKEFSKLLHIFASPQIKNNATLIGNVVNASPIGDTIPFLLVNEAQVEISSSEGHREININDFYKGGYKELDLAAFELVTKIKLAKSDFDYKLYKVSIRKDLDISSITFACRYKIENEILTDFSLALGGVGPIVMRMKKIEALAVNKKFERNLFEFLAAEVQKEIKPLSDHRGTSDFRLMLAKNLMLRFFDEVSILKKINFTEASV